MNYLIPYIIPWLMRFFNRPKKPAVDVSTECITNKAIEDLNPKNIANWDYDLDGTYYYKLRNKRKKYSINVSNYRQTAHINGVSWNLFAETQQRCLYYPAIAMINAIKDKTTFDSNSRDKKKLAKIFPECVK